MLYAIVLVLFKSLVSFYKVNIKLTNVHATSFLIYNLKAIYVYAMVIHKLILI
jgi:hypothetical protein